MDKDPNLSRNPGSLTRAHKLVLGRELSSIYTLEHWRSEPKPPVSRGNVRRHEAGFLAGKARLILVKTQECALNFLIRWFLLEEAEKTESLYVCSNDLARGSYLRSRQKKKTRPSLLLDNVAQLHDRRLATVIRFIFWRWLTWTNVFELILIVLLLSCCLYQCYELLAEYYQYPTYVSVYKTMNDNFRTDLPAVTLCTNNRMSKRMLETNFPRLNATHLMAISMGTFYSYDNFTLETPRSKNISSSEDSIGRDQEIARADKLTSDKIVWSEVADYLSRKTPRGTFSFLADDEFIDDIVCANIWGENMPCKNLKRIETVQLGAACFTLFMGAVLWDQSDPAVQELDRALSMNPGVVRFGDGQLLGEDQLVEFSDLREDGGGRQEQGEVDMGHMEMLRIRLNFKADDYANNKSEVGGLFAIHAPNVLGIMSHISYQVEPGYWYNYYIERFEYKRLPPPYKTNCYDYERSRHVWKEREKWMAENWDRILELIHEQALKPGSLVQEYVEYLRKRSLGMVSGVQFS